MSKWFPDRKILAGGLGMVVAWLSVQLLGTYTEVQLTMESATAIVGAVGMGLAYLVPPSVMDVIRRVDEFLDEFDDEFEEEEPAAPHA